MMYCAGTCCKKRHQCQHHIPKDTQNVLVEYIDYSTQGTGICNSERCTVTYFCGDNTEDYPLFSKV